MWIKSSHIFYCSSFTSLLNDNPVFQQLSEHQEHVCDEDKWSAARTMRLTGGKSNKLTKCLSTITAAVTRNVIRLYFFLERRLRVLRVCDLLGV